MVIAKKIAGSISGHLVDPELVSFVETLELPDPTDENIAAYRGTTEGLAGPCEPGVTSQLHIIPGPDGAPDIRQIIVRPDGLGPDAPVLFQIHGGGFIAGSPEATVPWASKLAKEAGCVVSLPSYRLAPETPWPGALDDLHAGLVWLAGQAESLGLDASRIAIGGVSAGGGHAAALTQRISTRGGPAVMFQMLHSPMLDDRQPESPYLGEFICNRAFDHYGWSRLLGRPAGGPDIPAEMVPGRVQDLSGLPAAYIVIGTLDLFAEASVDYARRLMVAGVPVELHLIPGLMHGGDFSCPDTTIAKRVQDDMPRALELAFTRAGATA